MITFLFVAAIVAVIVCFCTFLFVCAVILGGAEAPRSDGIWLEPVGSHETNPFAKKK
jgi:hypothetical protein